MDSWGKVERNALTTVRPPKPESKTPIGLESAINLRPVILLLRSETLQWR